MLSLGTVMGLIESKLSGVKNAIHGLDDTVYGVNEKIVEINALAKKTVIGWVNGGVGAIDSTGQVVTSSLSSHTDYVDVSGYSFIQYKREGITGYVPLAHMAFYDEAKQCIFVQGAKTEQAQGGYISALEKLMVPLNAKYARFSIYTNTGTYGSFELYGETRISNTVDSISRDTFITDNEVSLVNTFSGVIALYDDLVSKYGDYISKNTLTKNSLSLYEYILTTGNYNGATTQYTKDNEIQKPIILLTGGVHGYEQSAVMALYYICKKLCEKDPSLNEIRNYAEIRIIPIVCPSGYNNNSRLNSNSVNINRNFASDNWEQTSQGSQYSGASAGDQTETQIVQEWLTDHDDALVLFDCHNSEIVKEISVMLGESTGDQLAIKKKFLLGENAVVPYWQDTRDIDDTNIYAYTGISSATGTERCYAEDLGIKAFTVEMSWNINGSGQHSNFTIGTNAEVIGNLLMGVKEYLKDI